MRVEAEAEADEAELGLISISTSLSVSIALPCGAGGGARKEKVAALCPFGKKTWGVCFVSRVRVESCCFYTYIHLQMCVDRPGDRPG